MFESLSERLGSVFDRLTKQGALSEADVDTALREVRVALLEADVSLDVARNFVKADKTRAIGQAVTKSITPGQQVVKIVHDELVRVLAGDDEPEALKIDNPPSAILMVGLQGSGKTTTTAKLAKRLKERNGKRVLLASLDTNRPAAMEQLARSEEHTHNTKKNKNKHTPPPQKTNHEQKRRTPQARPAGVLGHQPPRRYGAVG